MSNVIYKKDTRRGVRLLVEHEATATWIIRDDTDDFYRRIVVREGWPVEIAIDADEIVITRLQEAKVG